MKSLKSIILSLVGVFLLLAAFLVVQVARAPICYSPLFLLNQANKPETITQDLIQQLGGLPKTDLDTYNVQPADAAIYEVKSWHIRSSLVNQPLSIIDDDPIYHLAFEIQTTFLDGDEATLQWSSWRYGIVACPVILSLGDGPPGELQVIR